MSIELIIFDCDGVLVDSEIIANQLLSDVLPELGINFTLQQTMAHFMGKSLPSCITQIEALADKPIPEDFWPRLNIATKTAFDKDLKAVTGIEAALQAIDLSICVASSGKRQKINHTLGLTGLRSYFGEFIFSADQVKRGKPAPDLFLFAAAQMGVEPRQCLVIEDSAFGVQAAVSANMQVLGYCERSSKTKLAGFGATTFEQMRDLPPMIKKLNNPR